MAGRIFSTALQRAVADTISKLRESGQNLDPASEASRLALLYPECTVDELIILLVDEAARQSVQSLPRTGEP